ncbi:MAG TPA: hypothetical protein VGD34_23095 [Kribbella sp.]|jgi:hypothetical protein
MAESRNAPDARTMLLEALIEKVADDQYPSITMLNIVESLLQPDEVPAYVEVLLQQVRQEKYPSIPMLRRIAALAS